jgi:hypothetical protein
MSDPLRSSILHIASDLPKGNKTRRALLKVLAANKFYKGEIVTPSRKAELWRPTTEAEVRAWEDSPASKGMTSGGDTKLPPREVLKSADGRTTYTVVRGAVRAERYYRTLGGLAQIQDASGTLWFVRKSDLSHAGKTATQDWFQKMLDEPLPEPTPAQRRETLKEMLSKAYKRVGAGLGRAGTVFPGFTSEAGTWGYRLNEAVGKEYTWHLPLVLKPAMYDDILQPDDVIGLWFKSQVGPGGRVYPSWGITTPRGQSAVERKEYVSGYHVAEAMKKYLKRL